MVKAKKGALGKGLGSLISLDIEETSTKKDIYKCLRNLAPSSTC